MQVAAARSRHKRPQVTRTSAQAWYHHASDADSWQPRTCRNKALAAKLEAERKLKEGISGHRTGLPKKLLELFAPLPLPGVLPELRKRPPKVPYTGIGQYVAGFAEKGDPEYEPEPEVPKPPSPRLFKNPELAVQARFDYETRAEKWVFPFQRPWLSSKTPAVVVICNVSSQQARYDSLLRH